MIKQQIIDKINSYHIGTHFTIHSFPFASPGYTSKVLRELYQTGYMDRECANSQTNRFNYWSLERIPDTEDGRKRNYKPSKRPYRLIVHVSQVVYNYLDQADNKSELADKILREAIAADNIEIISLRDIETVRLSLSLSDKVGQFFERVKRVSDTFDAMIKKRMKNSKVFED